MSTNLQETFQQATSLFNAGDYDGLGRIFDIDAIMKRVDDPGSIVGLGNLMAYLNTHQRPLMPQFQNPVVQYATGDQGTQGIIVGTANYLDKQSDRTTIPVQFTFVFAREDTSSDWLLVNAFAVPTQR